ncbi:MULTISPECIES: hypothetical protein [unclassified Chelatococcus]|uniref:hypothetical protein n=1 Tax=unclassified Chelatococcus TaxID=2638111 RepID=UPI0020BD8A21|nr:MULTISPECIES: hypothetical protein [unclassified Chelatococcus]MCO5077311.1 hypothetical protein [Chelatococcus sp.]CAH1670488.1 conserved hypothetical protein [Hyphomicrobiales bacterium]CAH1677282.1 conserved hypothetical protein [Hyphomicrobiales bacterium]
MRGFYIPYGENDKHAEALKAGLARLPSNFTAELCGWCEGRGRYSQTYNAGCGMGYFSAMGGCERCKGAGLIQGDKPASASVIHQVLNAGDRDG